MRKPRKYEITISSLSAEELARVIEGTAANATVQEVLEWSYGTKAYLKPTPAAWTEIEAALKRRGVSHPEML